MSVTLLACQTPETTGEPVMPDRAPRLLALRQADGVTLYRMLQDKPAPAMLLAVCVGGQYQSVAQRRMDHAFSFRARLDPAFATVPLQLTRHAGLPALLLTDPGGTPLHAILGRPLEPAVLLEIAIGIARALGSLHARAIVHKDLRPDNILVDDAHQVFLTGFGGASLITREPQRAEAALEMSDSLPYMSPEQTGRMNRSVDTRSDLYSFGVTLYRMATGVLPFHAVDAMEWIHCHVAREAPKPQGVAPALAAIVERLLSKTADERYQTAAGVEADLRRCAHSLARHGRIDDFPLAGEDVPDRLLVAEQIHGRETEIALLLDAWRRVGTEGRAELLLISGYSGIGKSAIVGELRKALVAQRGLFAAGKFEQHKRDIPYSTITQALRSLVIDVLCQDEAALDDWRRRLRETLGENGQAVVNLVPELELVIGRQPALKEVSPATGSLRFQQTVQRFIAAFCAADRPLVLFIDDLQWLDAATLDLVRALLTSPDFRHVLLIGAYRANQVDASHPVASTLAVLRATGMPMSELALSPLGVSHLEALVAQTLHDDEGRSRMLAALIWEKTQGNPFFANQFLAALAEEKLVWFDRQCLRWFWDVLGIMQRNYSDNVADLMADKLARLPPGARHGLGLLACLGASATQEMLAHVAGLSAAELHAQLVPAEQAGLVARGAGSYRFLHDRIQEAAYALTPVAERAATHLDIGRRLRLGASPVEQDKLIFELVNQYGRAPELMHCEVERLQVAGLYLRAARRAVAETAYQAALSYLGCGEQLLPVGIWALDYRLAFDLSRARAECEFVTGEPHAADRRLLALAARTNNLLDKASVTSLQVTVCIGLDESSRAIDLCLAFLQEVDTPLPLHPAAAEVHHEYALLRARIGARPLACLLDLPPVTDPLRRAILDVMASVLPSAFFRDENLVCLLMCRMANLSFQYGNADGSPLAYAYLGMMVGPYFGDHEAAFPFGKLGFDLVEQGGFTRYKPRVYMAFAYHVIPWVRDIRTGQDLLRRAYQVARETGDITYAGFSACTLVTSLLASGDPLDIVRREAEERLDFVTSAKFGLIIHIITAQQRLMATLQGQTAVFGCFDGGAFEEAAFERHLDANRNLDIAACWYWIRKAQARFLAGDIAAARSSMQRAEPLLWTTRGHFEFAEFHFYGGLIRAACSEGAEAGERQAHLAALDGHRALVDGWARHCPDNFLCRSALLAAEAARLRGQDLDAMRHYEAAIAAARSAAFPHNEALALELSARFHVSRGLHAAAGGLIRAARLAYQRWGAVAKVRQLDLVYPVLHAEFLASRGEDMGRRLGALDVDTLLRTSQAVAAEKGLPRLMHTLMTIALEHAGAERGMLVLPHGDCLRIEARATSGPRGVQVELKSCEASCDRLPLPMLHFAIRTRSHVLIDDARLPGQFAADPYLLTSRARSVLCLPLLRQGESIGLLYLENSLAGGAFTPERVALLTLLASTAATSMQNASLEEKESLLQEVHHRVKNNLQLISSLLNLQASRIADPAVAELFADSRNRVRSMALVHENLYRAGNFARVPMAAHIDKLCAQLARAYGSDAGKVRLSTQVEDIHLPLNRAVSCGLIVNELVSNALKHAFPGERKGEIRITLVTTAQGRLALTVADDGVGLPGDMDVAQADSLGLQLVDDLSHQLHGELVARRDHGTVFVVTFAADTQAG